MIEKRIWITGASSGIGKALAVELVKQGSQLVISARRAVELETLADQLSVDTAGAALHERQVTALPLDLATDFDVSAARKALEESLGKVDICIICAGHCEYMDDVNKIDVEMFRRVFDINFFGAVRTVKTVLPIMKNGFSTAEKPMIVIVSSLASIVPFPRAEAYGASKAALSYFAESLRLDLIDSGVDVLLVDPGFVKTPMTDKNDFDMPFLVDTDLATQKILKGIEKRAFYVAFPRRLSWLLRSLSIVPGLWNKVIGPRLRKSV